MRHLLFFLILFNFSFFSAAQKANFRAAEKFMEENLTNKYGDLDVNANWIGESDIFWYSFKNSSGKNFYYVNAASGKKQLMFDSRYMAAELRRITHHPYNELDLPIKDIKFEKRSTTRLTFVVDTIKFLFDISGQKLVQLGKLEKEERKTDWANYSPDSIWVAFARNQNLFIFQLTTRKMLLWLRSDSSWSASVTEEVVQ